MAVQYVSAHTCGLRNGSVLVGQGGSPASTSLAFLLADSHCLFTLAAFQHVRMHQLLLQLGRLSAQLMSVMSLLGIY